MFAFLKSIRNRWANWCGDRDLEQSIRKHLSTNGYYGGSAKLLNVRLAAVQRPGWLQVFRFDALAKPSVMAMEKEVDGVDDEIHDSEVSEVNRQLKHLFGLVREDARKGLTTVRTFEKEDDRRELFIQWSENLVQLRGGRAIT